MFALGYRYEQRHIGAFYDDNEPALDWVFVDPVTDKWVSTHPRDFTSSLDDVRALIDPADEWELTTLYGVARAAVGLNRDHQTGWPGYGEHEGGDPVRALLSAALKARKIGRAHVELQSLMRISYAVFCLKKKTIHTPCTNQQH